METSELIKSVEESFDRGAKEVSWISGNVADIEGMRFLDNYFSCNFHETYLNIPESFPGYNKLTVKNKTN